MRTRIATFLLAAIPIAGSVMAATHEVVIPSNQNAFVPPTVNIAAGDTVRWIRMGGYHQVAADDGSFTGPLPGAWGTYERTFNSAGSVPYYCTQHADPGGNTMNGLIVVSGGGGAPGTLAFTGSASRSVGEGAGNLTVTVQRTGGSTGSVSVDYETVNNGTAGFPGDYIQANDTLDWGNGDSSSKSFNVTIVNDTEIEGNETFSIQLINPTGGASLGLANTTVTITDNDSTPGSPGAIRFASSSASVDENDGDVSLAVRRVGGSTGAVSATWATASGTAVSGSDFTSSNDVVSWGNGDSADKSISVPIADDTVEEPAESFTVSLSAPSGGATLGSPDSSTVTIADNDLTCDPCVADATTLCLAGGSGDPQRFRVKVRWTDFVGGSGDGQAVPYTPDSGFFYFFSSDNVELIAKIVNGCGSPFDAYWFFYAAASNVQLRYEVLDTTACVAKYYDNPLGNFASDGDIAALETCDAGVPALAPAPVVRPVDGSPALPFALAAPRGPEPGAGPREAVTSSAAAPFAGEGGSADCVSDATTLCLAGGSGTPGRFEVKVLWTDFADNTGNGQAVPFTPDSGFFYFFNEDNVELIAKIVNGCGSAFDNFWFFYAAASNVGLEYRLRDTVTGAQRTYFNPRGNFASNGHIDALPCSLSSAVAP